MDSCAFCGIIDGTHRAHTVFEDETCVGFLDNRPVFPGHTLVVPRLHYETLPDLPGPLLAPLFTAVQRMAVAMVEGLGAEGSFVAANNVVSQSVPHLHIHVVPRRRKDGLRGFFWPRQKYADDDEMAGYAARLRAVLGTI